MELGSHRNPNTNVNNSVDNINNKSRQSIANIEKLDKISELQITINDHDLKSNKGTNRSRLSTSQMPTASPPADIEYNPKNVYGTTIHRQPSIHTNRINFSNKRGIDHSNHSINIIGNTGDMNINNPYRIEQSFDKRSEYTYDDREMFLNQNHSNTSHNSRVLFGNSNCLSIHYRASLKGTNKSSKSNQSIQSTNLQAASQHILHLLQ